MPLFEAERLLTFSAFRMGANSRLGADSNKYGTSPYTEIIRGSEGPFHSITIQTLQGVRSSNAVKFAKLDYVNVRSNKQFDRYINVLTLEGKKRNFCICFENLTWST